MREPVEPVTSVESRSERWVLGAGRRSRGRSATISIAILAAVSGLMLVIAVVQRDALSLVMSALFMLIGVLTFERRVFDRIVRRQAAEIAHLRGGGGD